MISIARLYERLRYDPATGKLFWRFHPSMPKHWNTRYAGREAFAVRRPDGRLEGRIDSIKISAHRVVWAMHYGVWPTNQIDHEEQDPGCNIVSGLRDVTGAANKANTRMQANNTSGACGVYWDKSRNKWMAAIKVAHRMHFLGRFDLRAEAVAARKAAERHYGFHQNHGREATPKFPAPAVNTALRGHPPENRT